MPRLKFFRAIEAELRFQPHQLLMVGDDVANDIEGANQAGWYSLRLDRDKTGNAAGTIRSLLDIMPLLT